MPAAKPAAKAAAKPAAKAAAKPAAKAGAKKPAAKKAAGKDAAEAPKRKLMVDILEISISNARCRSHILAALVPAETEELLSEKRAALKAAKLAATEAGTAVEDDANVTAAKAEFNEASETVVRVGGDAPIVMASLCDFAVKSMLRAAMDQTTVAGGKMVDIAALHSGNPESLDVWPLICNLPAIANYDAAEEAALKIQQAADNKAVKDARVAAKAAAEAGAAAPEAVEEVVDEDDEEAHGPATTFHTYVDAATKVVKSEEGRGAMRIASRLRNVLSDVVAQLVAQYALMAKAVVLDVVGVRTLSAHHLQALVKVIFISKLCVEDDENMELILAYTEEKVALYHAHLAAEKARKDAEMLPEKRADLEAKKEAAALAKKQRDADQALTKAKALAAKAKQLKAELAA